MEIYLYHNEQKLGPFTWEDIQSMLASEAITATDHGWREGMADWQPLNSFLPLALPASSANPPREQSPEEPVQSYTEPVQTDVKQGAVIGGWVCFLLGMAAMTSSMWSFVFYAPLFFVAFILSIVAMSQRRVFLGLLLLLATLFVPIIFGSLVTFRNTLLAVDKVIGTPKVVSVTSQPIATPSAASQPLAIQSVATSSATSKPVTSPHSTPPVIQSQPLTVNFQTIAADRNLWPKYVVLKAPTAIPIVIDGEVAGTATLPIGTIVQLVSVNANGEVVVAQNGAQTSISAHNTNLVEVVSHAEQPKAKFELRLVHPQSDQLIAAIEGGQMPIPPGYRIDTVETTRNGKTEESKLLVHSKIDIEGKYVKSGTAMHDEQGYGVSLQFTPEGANIFGQLTKNHVGERFAIILDGKILRAPVIKDAIWGGRLLITGNFTEQEARKLASVLENPL